MGLRDRLRARQLPTKVVSLPAADGGDPELIELRALPAEEWEALVQLHPPTEQDRAQGAGWNVTTFRPALLGVSVVVPDDEEPLSEQDWAELIACRSMTAGEINLLFNTACVINDRAPSADLGKG